MAEKTGAKAHGHDTGNEQPDILQRCRGDDQHERRDAYDGTGDGHAERIDTAAEDARGEGKAQQAATGKGGGELGRRADAEAEHLAAIGFEQHIGHAEGEGAEADGDEARHGIVLRGIAVPAFPEGWRDRIWLRAQMAGPTRLLLPQRDEIQEDGDHRRALDDLDQPPRREVDEEGAERQRADDRSDQQHDIHQPDDIGLILFGRQIGGKRKADRLVDMDARTGEEDGERCGRLADPRRCHVGLHRSRQHQQRERHQCEAAKLHHGAAKDVGNAPQPQRRDMIVRFVADKGPQRREQQWQ